MRIPKIAIPCAVLLTGYASLAKQGPSDAAAPAIEPGQWEFATELILLDMPGAPEELVTRMRAAMANEREVSSRCVTLEQARAPAQNLMMASPNQAGCDLGETFWAGGVIRIRATCRSSEILSDTAPESAPASPPAGSLIQLSIEGSYVPRQIDGRMNVAMAMPDSTGSGAATQLRLQARMTGRRTGDCATPDPRANENSLAPVN